MMTAPQASAAACSSALRSAALGCHARLDACAPVARLIAGGARPEDWRRVALVLAAVHGGVEHALPAHTALDAAFGRPRGRAAAACADAGRTVAPWPAPAGRAALAAWAYVAEGARGGAPHLLTVLPGLLGRPAAPGNGMDLPLLLAAAGPLASVRAGIDALAWDGGELVEAAEAARTLMLRMIAALDGGAL